MLRDDKHSREKKKRRPPKGEATNNIVLSAYTGSNDEVFPYVLSLYMKPGSKVADVTYGKGVFWKRVTEGTYEILSSDISNGVDCRDLPYGDRLTRRCCL